MGVLLGWLAVVTGLAGAGFHAANEAEGRTSEPSFWLMGLGASLAYGLAALLLRGADARRIQLLLGGIGLAQGLALLASEWGLLDEQIPLRSWAVWLGSWLWAPAYAAIAAVLPLVLPDGRLPSSRWRPAMWLAVTAVLVTSVTWALTPYDAQDFPEALEGSTNPVGVEGIGAAWVSALGGVLVVAVLTALAALASRWRQAGYVSGARWPSGRRGRPTRTIGCDRHARAPPSLRETSTFASRTPAPTWTPEPAPRAS